MSMLDLPIVSSYDRKLFVLLDDLSFSLLAPETEKAFVTQLGKHRGEKFAQYVRSQNMTLFVKVFCIEPVGQYKPPSDFTKRGRGVYIYNASVIEAALLVAFNLVYPKDVPVPVDLPPL